MRKILLTLALSFPIFCNAQNGVVGCYKESESSECSKRTASIECLDNFESNALLYGEVIADFCDSYNFFYEQNNSQYRTIQKLTKIIRKLKHKKK